jgi:hypothetical protein
MTNLVSNICRAWSTTLPFHNSNNNHRLNNNNNNSNNKAIRFLGLATAATRARKTTSTRSRPSARRIRNRNARTGSGTARSAPDSGRWLSRPASEASNFTKIFSTFDKIYSTVVPSFLGPRLQKMLPKEKGDLLKNKEIFKGNITDLNNYLN